MSIALPRRQEAARLARLALAEYGLARAAIRLVGCVNNFVFRVTVRKVQRKRRMEFALRLHQAQWHTPAQIESELLWLEAIGRRTELVVPRPVRNRAGGLLTTLGDDGHGAAGRHCSLLTWLPGRCYWKRPSPQWVRQIGRLMASLQLHGQSYQRPIVFAPPRWDAAAMMGRGGILAPSWDRIPRRAAHVLTEVRSRFEPAAAAVGTGGGNSGLIHGDLHVGNAISHEGTIAAIDFDDCCDGYYLSDLAAALDLLEWRQNYCELRSALIEGYCQEVQVPNARQECLTHQAGHLNHFLAARWVMLCLFLARRSETAPTLARVLNVVIPKLKKFLRDPRSLG